MATETKRRFAVITGASSGIGFELARQCIEHDFDVVVCSEDGGIADAAARLTTTGGFAYPVEADLSAPGGVEELYRVTRSMARPIDALILNAGVGVGGEFLETDLARELRMVALNCNHTVHLAKLVLPDLVRRGQGRILMTGSVVSASPAPCMAVYGATQAFVMSFGEALRYELKDTGVTVTVLQPSATDTYFFARTDLERMPRDAADAGKHGPAKIARDGFEAMMAGKDSVLGGSVTTSPSGLAHEDRYRGARSVRPQ